MMSTDEHRLNELSERIFGCAYKVANTLGLNYLKATELRLCLLLNFGRARIEVRRVIL